LPTPPKDVVLSKKKLGERLRALREHRGLSQGQLAAIVGAHPQSVSQVERGVRGLTVQQVVKLARALKVPTDEILGEGQHAKPFGNGGSRRFIRRLQKIQDLPPTQQKALLKLIDGALGIGGHGRHA
jgi:transcriptional regulator with XRE-family HTH domain